MDIKVARIRQDGSEPHPQLLIEHLNGVALRAGASAAHFSASDWARLAGLWHDLGKYRPGFQRYIRDSADAHCETTVTPRDKTHSAAGALWALQTFSENHGGRIFAYLIASHHAGLYDWEDLAARMASDDAKQELAEAIEQAPKDLLSHEDFVPDLTAIPGGSAGFHLWLRLLFSVLVDADFLDTEAFMSANKLAGRDGFPSLAELKTRFDGHMTALAANAKSTPVNVLRADILLQCRAKAALPPGIFSLTVPTGGGKTLSSMAFALDHAVKHGHRRVIYTIPYTSIIEQTADVFRRIFGEDSFIEHHSNAEADPSREDHRTRLACENWDAPLVVTTNVQLFESLFAARTSRCRKLHNLVGSIIVLDEAQLLPPEFLQPIVDVLKLLTTHYGVTLLLCTATQPALSSQTRFDPRRGFRGFENVAEIMDDPDALYASLKRVRVTLPVDLNAQRDWDGIASDIAGHDSVLAIVNTKKSAYELWQRLPGGTVHLSSLMCGQHRSDIIQRIRARLEDKRVGRDDAALRVISTQLIEAGVDVDFPVVYRALAGLDSIAQAAGRCNREGRLDTGQVHVFVPPINPPPGLLRKGAECCKLVWHGHAGDPLDLPLYARYFRQLYGSCDLDEKRVAPDLTTQGHGEHALALKLREVSKKFKLIDDNDTAAIIVKYYGQDGQDRAIDGLIGKLKSDGPETWLMRKLQRYTVTLYARDVLRMLAQGDVAELFPGIYVQVSDVLYHPILGVNVDGLPGDPAQMVL
jgi:CRISPR-associated endonuclease/helicase Cas3